MKNSIFARFARAFFIFWRFEDVLVLSTTWNDLFCCWVGDLSIWWQMFNFVFLYQKRWFQFNSRIVRTYSSSMMTLNNWKMIAEMSSYIFRWRSRFCRRRVYLSSLLVPWERGRSSIFTDCKFDDQRPHSSSNDLCWVMHTLFLFSSGEVLKERQKSSWVK